MSFEKTILNFAFASRIYDGDYGMPSAAIAILLEEDKLDLEDDVRSILIFRNHNRQRLYQEEVAEIFFGRNRK